MDGRAPQRRRKVQTTNMTNAEANIAATVAAQGAHGAPEKASPKKGATRQKQAPKAKKTATGRKPQAAVKKEATTRTNAAKPLAAREGSKKAQILDLLRRKQGVTLADLMKACGWQAHSVRGFLSGAVGKKMGLEVTSTKDKRGERTYRVAS